jgi:GT2 family glycosyltransferase
MGVRLLRLAQNWGASRARNHGARHARGDILFFVDADVVVAAGAVVRVAQTFAEHPDLAAVFGSYDAEPRAAGVVSQFRNLLHHYTHQNASPEAFTFWSGCGAIRRAVFEALGGFSEARTVARSIQDIELGYRLRRAGHRIRLDKGLQCTHLKRWTLGSMIRTDVALRAVPWARLILEHKTAPADLNLRGEQRLSLALVGIAGASLLLTLARREWLLLAAAALVGVAVLNRHLYAFFYRQRGLRFAMASFPLHLVYFLCGGLGFLYVWLGQGLRGGRTTLRNGEA